MVVGKPSPRPGCILAAKVGLPPPSSAIVPSRRGSCRAVPLLSLGDVEVARASTPVRKEPPAVSEPGPRNAQSVEALAFAALVGP